MKRIKQTENFKDCQVLSCHGCVQDPYYTHLTDFSCKVLRHHTSSTTCLTSASDSVEEHYWTAKIYTFTVQVNWCLMLSINMNTTSCQNRAGLGYGMQLNTIHWRKNTCSGVESWRLMLSQGSSRYYGTCSFLNTKHEGNQCERKQKIYSFFPSSLEE